MGDSVIEITMYTLMIRTVFMNDTQLL